MLAPPGEDFAQNDNKVNNRIVAVTVNHRAICITEFMTLQFRSVWELKVLQKLSLPAEQ